MPENNFSDDQIAEALSGIPPESGIPYNGYEPIESGEEVNIGHVLAYYRYTGRPDEPNENLKDALREHGLEIGFRDGRWKIPENSNPKVGPRVLDEEHARGLRQKGNIPDRTYLAISNWRRRGRATKPSDDLIAQLEARNYKVYSLPVGSKGTVKYKVTTQGGDLPESATRLTASRVPAGSFLPADARGAANTSSSATRTSSPPVSPVTKGRKR
ncbi:hypothetical protein [Streptomyces sp. NPDC059850]|uniref:hypothetical protein n=1 Tax=Streptomyces sp. NPDC059850 TaxID=3346970 RepID=UPI003658D083